MPALLPIRFRTELARSFHRDIINTLNVPSGDLNTLNTLDTKMFTYTASAGTTTFSGEDDKGVELTYTPGRVEVFVDGDKVLTDDYIATNGSSITLLTATGEEQTILTINGIEFAAADVNSGNDSITKVDHGFNEGDKIVYFENGASSGILNLYNGESYYVIVIDDDTIKLASSRAYAIATTPTPIAIDASSAVGTAFQLILVEEYNDGEVVDEQLLNITGSRVQTTGINIGTETITLASHGFSDDDVLLYYSNGGTAIAGLTNDTTYYVVNATANTFQLSASSGGSVINLTGTGNSNQSFIKMDSILYVPSHGFASGQEVIFTNDTGSITGLSDGTHYYIIKLTDDTLQLATSYSNALAGTFTPLKPLFGIGDNILEGPLEQTITINTFTLTNYPNPHDYFYVFLARPLAWANEPTAPTPVDSRMDDSEVKRNILGVKKINPSDITMIVRRIDW